MLTEMVMATLLVNVFGVAAALPFIAAQNLLSRSLQTESAGAFILNGHDSGGFSARQMPVSATVQLSLVQPRAIRRTRQYCWNRGARSSFPAEPVSPNRPAGVWSSPVDPRRPGSQRVRERKD